MPVNLPGSFTVIGFSGMAEILPGSFTVTALPYIKVRSGQVPAARGPDHR